MSSQRVYPPDGKTLVGLFVAGGFLGGLAGLLVASFAKLPKTRGIMLFAIGFVLGIVADNENYAGR